MTAPSILCYALLLIVPALALRSAMLCRSCASTPGAKKGYHSRMNLSAPEHWAYAQKLASSRYILAAAVMAVLGIGFMAFMPAADLVSLLFCCGIALGLEFVALLMIMSSIEMGLNSHFKTPAV